MHHYTDTIGKRSLSFGSALASLGYTGEPFPAIESRSEQYVRITNSQDSKYRQGSHYKWSPYL